MQDLPLFISIAGNIAAVIGIVVLAAKLAVARAIADDADDEVTQLHGVINAMKSDAAIGRKARLQRSANLRKMQAKNAARKAG